ncbi:MAG: hypothetical protein HYV19_00145 [Gemmatimonadetes bacterium]|nr:hypothetical protein [Gemmatimonadota bacterium]
MISPPVSSGVDAAGAADGRNAWLQIHHALFAGLNHALSNRVMGIESALTISERRGVVDWSLMTGEQARLERLLQLYRLLEVVEGERAEPMHISEPVADANDLLAHHLELRDVAVESDPVPPTAVVSLPRRLAARSFLVLLYEAARRAHPEAPSVRWSFEAGVDDITVMATVRPAPDADPGDAMLAAALLVGAAPGAVWSVRDPGRSYAAAMKLPLLHAGRRH